MYLPGSALSSVQFRSKKRGRIFWTRINAQKRSKNAPKRPKTPQNAPKRPKTPQKRPKTPPKRPFFGPENARFFQFSSVQVSVFRSGQFRSFQVSSGQVPDLIGRSGQSGQVNLTCRWGPEILSHSQQRPTLRDTDDPGSEDDHGSPDRL